MRCLDDAAFAVCDGRAADAGVDTGVDGGDAGAVLVIDGRGAAALGTGGGAGAWSRAGDAADCDVGRSDTGTVGDAVSLPVSAEATTSGGGITRGALSAAVDAFKATELRARDVRPRGGAITCVASRSAIVSSATSRSIVCCSSA